MIVQNTFERGSRKDAQLGIAQRDNREITLSRVGLAEEIGGVEQANDLFASVSGCGDELEHTRQQVAADYCLFACPSYRLAGGSSTTLAQHVERRQFPIVETAAQSSVAYGAISTDCC